MRLLLTNDDGIDAPGLAVLARVGSQLGTVVTVAPTECCSGCGHQVTTQRPLQVHHHGPDRVAVDGWPVDCVRVGLRGLESQVDWVLSGINAGGNLGADVYISGTVAAIREAVLLGKPGIALSHYKRREFEYDWDRAARWTLAILRELMERPCEPGTFWNVNLPHLSPDAPEPAIHFCPLDSHALPVQYHREGARFRYSGDYHERPRHAGHDVDVCFSGNIAVSLLRVG
jgi:5'-nucleotidase